jgi:GNAT superfamily N-acetyltransferase
MIRLLRTNSENQEFIALVRCLDAELVIIDGEEHSFYAPFNTIENIRYAIVAYHDGKPVGCGALKEFVPTVMEIKRMYTAPSSRGMGIASGILHELENWASEMSYDKCLVETGKRQPEAVALYKKNGYGLIPNYGQYANVENSVCFEKHLNNSD